MDNGAGEVAVVDAAVVDVAVVGGGLAGLHAAGSLAASGCRCVAFTGSAPGGLLLSIEQVQGLPEHPEGIAGYDLGPMAQEAAMDAGARCLALTATSLRSEGGLWRIEGEGESVLARAVVLAPGAALRALGVPGEARLAGKGVSHCASCDAPLMRGRTVMVVGGGDAACQEALTLAQHASRVHLLVRGAALRARAQWRERVAASPRIEIRLHSEVAEILGDTAVTGVRLADGATLAAEGVFIYTGLVPATAWLAGVAPMSATGHLIAGPRLHTAVRGLLAAGVARAGHSGQAADALADGRLAAEAAHEFVQTGAWPAVAGA